MRDKICKPPTSILTHQNKFQVQFDQKQWEHIFMIPRYSCSDSYTGIFQFKILHNILFLNDRLYHFNLSDTKLCSLCGQENETPEHLFSNCNNTKILCNALRDKLKNSIALGPLTPQSAIFGFTSNIDDANTKNHLLLIFKCFVYKYQILHFFTIILNQSLISKRLLVRYQLNLCP